MDIANATLSEINAFKAQQIRDLANCFAAGWNILASNSACWVGGFPTAIDNLQTVGMVSMDKVCADFGLGSFAQATGQTIGLTGNFADQFPPQVPVSNSNVA